MSFRNIGILPGEGCFCDCETKGVKMIFDILLCRYKCPKCGACIDEQDVFDMLCRIPNRK